MWKRIRRDLGKTGESFWIPENLEIKEKGNRMERREIYTKITGKAETMKQELVRSGGIFIAIRSLAGWKCGHPLSLHLI